MPKGPSFLPSWNTNLWWRRNLTGLLSRQPVQYMPPFLPAEELSHFIPSPSELGPLLYSLSTQWLLLRRLASSVPSSGLEASPHSPQEERELSHFFLDSSVDADFFQCISLPKHSDCCLKCAEVIFPTSLPSSQHFSLGLIVNQDPLLLENNLFCPHSFFIKEGYRLIWPLFKQRSSLGWFIICWSVKTQNKGQPSR